MYLRATPIIGYFTRMNYKFYCIQFVYNLRYDACCYDFFSDNLLSAIKDMTVKRARGIMNIRYSTKYFVEVM